MYKKTCIHRIRLAQIAHGRRTVRMLLPEHLLFKRGVSETVRVRASISRHKAYQDTGLLHIKTQGCFLLRPFPPSNTGGALFQQMRHARDGGPSLARVAPPIPQPAMRVLKHVKSKPLKYLQSRGDPRTKRLASAAM